MHIKSNNNNNDININICKGWCISMHMCTYLSVHVPMYAYLLYVQSLFTDVIKTQRFIKNLNLPIPCSECDRRFTCDMEAFQSQYKDSLKCWRLSVDTVSDW